MNLNLCFICHYSLAKFVGQIDEGCILADSLFIGNEASKFVTFKRGHLYLFGYLRHHFFFSTEHQFLFIYALEILIDPSNLTVNLRF